MQTRKIDGKAVRFNLPTADGQTGRLVVDGQTHEIEQGTGFTLASVTLSAGGHMIFRQHSGQPWRLVGDIVGRNARAPCDCR